MNCQFVLVNLSLAVLNSFVLRVCNIEKINHLSRYLDDMHLRIYNYNTMEKIKDLESHADYIRFIEIHPIKPCILSSSDDMSMKLWNWEQNWECTATFEGHAHYVMMCKFNPKDANTFASASLDRTIKVPNTTAATAGYYYSIFRSGVLVHSSHIFLSRVMNVV